LGQKPNFTAEIISDLRGRVIAHNALAEPDRQTKLQELKKRYIAAYSGPDPHGHALQKIDGFLDGLSKGFDPGKHPRSKGGKFAGKNAPARAPIPVKVELPSSAAEHQELQAENPAYHAITSDVIPDTRHEAEGAALKTGISIALGTAAILSAYRSGPRGLLARALANATGKPTRWAVGAGAGAALYGGEAAGNKAAQIAGRIIGKKIADTDFHTAKAATRAVADAAEWAGRKPGQLAGLAVPLAIRGGVKLAQAPIARLPANATRLQRGLHRAQLAAAKGGVLAGASLAAGGAIDHAWTNSGIADPESIGKTYDHFSYRTIEKLAGDRAFDGEYDRQLAELRKIYGDDEGTLGRILDTDALRKNFPVSAVFAGAKRAINIGAAALAGGAVGAGVGAGVHHVFRARPGQSHGFDPYRDSKGRFASGPGASSAIGAVVAGTAAALGVYAALRGHNTAILRKVIAGRLAHSRRIIDKINSDEGHGPVAKMISGKLQTIAQRVQNDKKLSDQLEEIDRYGASHSAHYKEAIRTEVNQRLAELLVDKEEFAVPAKYAGGYGVTRLTKVRDAIGAMKPGEFKAAISKLTPKEQEQALQLFNGRQGWIDDVDAQLAGHHAAIDKAAADVERARTERVAAATATRDARATQGMVGEKTDEQKAADLAAVGDAEAKEIAASTIEREAIAKHTRLKGGAKIMSPLEPGRRIKPFDTEKAKSDLRTAAEKKHAAAVDREIDHARSAQLQSHVAHHDRLLLARAGLYRGAIGPGAEDVLGPLKSAVGLTQKTAEKSATPALRDALHNGSSAMASFHEAEAKHAAALADHAASMTELKNAKIAAVGKTPKGLTEVQAQQLRDDHANIEDRVRQHAATVADRARELATARSRMHDAAVHIEETAAGAGVRSADGSRFPLAMRAHLAAGFRQISAGPAAAATQFLSNTTAKNFRNYAKKTGQSAKAFGTRMGAGFKGTTAAAFMRDDDVHGRVIDPIKTFRTLSLVGGAVGGIAGAVEGAAKLKDYIGDLASKDRRATARNPINLKFEDHPDPFGGGGWHAITVPDPARKDERLVLWGERTTSATSRPEPIAAGARLSSVKQKISDLGNRPAFGDQQQAASVKPINLPHISDEDRAATGKVIGELYNAKRMQAIQAPPSAGQIMLRHQDEQKGQAEAGKVMEAIRKVHTGHPTGKIYFDALSAATNSREGRVLQAHQVYGLLTGYKKGGDPVGKGIFAKNEGFASRDAGDVAKALTGEVGRSEVSPRDDQQKAALTRAVAIVAHVKGLSAEQTKPIYDKIGGSKSEAPAAVIGQTDLGRSRQKSRMDDDVTQGGRSWDKAALTNLAHKAAVRISSMLDMHDENIALQVRSNALGIEMLARQVNAVHGLSMNESVEAVQNAIRSLAKGQGDVQRTIIRDGLRDRDAEAFSNELDRQAQEIIDRRMAKLAGADDFEILEKGWAGVASEARDRLGEWTSGGAASAARTGEDEDAKLSTGQVALKETADGVVDAAARASSKPAPTSRVKAPTPWYAPSRLAPEIGTFVAGDALGLAAKDLLGPEGKLGALAFERLGGSKLAGSIARKAIKGTAIAGAGTAGSIAGGISGGALVRGKANIPEDSAPKQLASFGGNVVGGIAGNYAQKAIVKAGAGAAADLAGKYLGEGAGAFVGSAAGPVGTVLGGALGSLIFGHVAEGAYDKVAPIVSRYFGGYDQKHAASVMARYTAPKPQQAA
jgi:hypothetical protein